MPIPPIPENLPILLRRGQHPLLIMEASATPAVVDPTTFSALGYRQTMLAAAKGGKLLNANGFRFRNGGMRALARTFRGKPFITGHDWGDVRARGGTIADAHADEIENDTEFGIFYDVKLQAAWAIEALANGTLDRFSLGVSGVGEITCTVHDAPVFTECWCFPGEPVTMEVVDGKDRKLVDVVAEWEYEGGIGNELSGVNVPAVDGTSIIEVAKANRSGIERLLAEVCGRTPPPRRHSVGGAQQGGFAREPAPITMAITSNEVDHMDRALICKSLGLPANATDEEILAKMSALGNDAAQVGTLRAQLADVAAREQTLAAERDAQHVESEITRLRAARRVGDKVVASLRETAKQSRAAFDSALALVEESAPEIAPGGATLAAAAQGGNPGLQSSSAPATNPGAAQVGEEGPDAYEANRTNADVPRFMRWTRVENKDGTERRLTAEDIRNHGSRQFTVLPNLRELADNTTARGDRPGVGK